MRYMVRSALAVILVGVSCVLLAGCLRSAHPPIAIMECVQVAPAEFEVSAAASHDPDGEITSDLWEFGDGDTSESLTASHIYDDPGAYTICLTITDDSGFRAQKRVHVFAFREYVVPTDVRTIQGAIDLAEDGDLIRVLRGTYVENVNFLGKAVVVRAQTPMTATIQAGEKEVAGSRLPAVTFNSGESRDSVLEGFILQGPGPLTVNPYSGAGITAIGSSPTIRGCTIQNCQAMEGAGIYAYESNMLLENCRVVYCRATLNGGGILMIGEGRFPELRECVISSNRADAGGGVYIGTAHDTELLEDAVLPVISDCTITENTATGSPGSDAVGGGIEVGTGCRYVGDGNAISGNSPCDVAYHDSCIQQCARLMSVGGQVTPDTE